MEAKGFRLKLDKNALHQKVLSEKNYHAPSTLYLALIDQERMRFKLFDKLLSNLVIAPATAYPMSYCLEQTSIPLNMSKIIKINKSDILYRAQFCLSVLTPLKLV